MVQLPTLVTTLLKNRESAAPKPCAHFPSALAPSSLPLLPCHPASKHQPVLGREIETMVAMAIRRAQASPRCGHPPPRQRPPLGVAWRRRPAPVVGVCPYTPTVTGRAAPRTSRPRPPRAAPTATPPPPPPPSAGGPGVLVVGDEAGLAVLNPARPPRPSRRPARPFTFARPRLRWGAATSPPSSSASPAAWLRWTEMRTSRRSGARRARLHRRAADQPSHRTATRPSPSSLFASRA